MIRRGLSSLLLIFLLSVLVSSSPFIVRRVPVLYKRISHRLPIDTLIIEDFPLSPILWRSRRSQPEVDYTDEFSADPFEQPLLPPKGAAGRKLPPRF